MSEEKESGFMDDEICVSAAYAFFMQNDDDAKVASPSILPSPAAIGATSTKAKPLKKTRMREPAPNANPLRHVEYALRCMYPDEEIGPNGIAYKHWTRTDLQSLAFKSLRPI